MSPVTNGTFRSEAPSPATPVTLGTFRIQAEVLPESVSPCCASPTPVATSCAGVGLTAISLDASSSHCLSPPLFKK